MIDFSQLLAQKTDAITEQWISAVEHDQQIVTTETLSRSAIRNHIPHVLKALTTVLSHSEDNDVETIARASIQHGSQRAEQGFEPTEIAREYHLLRSVILRNLREGLLTGTTEEVLRAITLINVVVDAAVAECFNSYVNQRLQELEQVQHQLYLTNQELQRLVMTSQENLAHLAHELKTPLNSIIGYSELFLRQQRTQVKDSMHNIEHIERVLRNGRQLLCLINDALDLSRYDAGKLKLNRVKTSISSVVEAVAELIQPLINSRNLELQIDCKNAPPQVWTDALRLQQVLLNLVSNAIRYTEAGRITIICQTLNDQQWSLEISDTGVGIAPEEQTNIFEPYGRVPMADQSYLPDSTGLGLAIVKRLINLLQGEILLSSTVGVGSTFTVIFPISIDQA